MLEKVNKNHFEEFKRHCSNVFILKTEIAALEHDVRSQS
jgi:hypothetical protein